MYQQHHHMEIKLHKRINQIPSMKVTYGTNYKTHLKNILSK
jgi:hypothetical protein